MNIKDFKIEFDDIFITELNNLISDAINKINNHPTCEYLEYITDIASNGKRIRPYNAALTYTIYSGKNWQNIKDTLIGIELIHMMALIHDDIMDESDTRHGTTSVHKFIEKDLDSKVDNNITKHTSQSLAILVGDLVFSWAYAKFNKGKQTKDSWAVINLLLEEVILGQMMDVYNPIEKSTTMDRIENKMLLKTARYTFTHQLILGAVLAEIENQDTTWIKDFGDSVGLLFQMQDDIFDFTKDVTTLKKNPLGDIKNGTNTLISMYVMQNASEEEKNIWSKWFGNKDLNNQEEIINFLESVGVWNFTENYIKQKEMIALDAVSKSGLKDEDMDKIKNLLSVVTNRKH